MIIDNDNKNRFLKNVRQEIYARFVLVFCLTLGLFPSYGDAALISIRDVVSNSSPQESSDHTIEFSSSYTIPVNGEIVITPQSGVFLIPTGLNILDIDVLVNGVNKSIGVPGNIIADMTVSIIPGAKGSIRIIPRGSTISARSKVTIDIGRNAEFGASGINQIKNPVAPGSYSLGVTIYDASHAYIDGMDTIVVMLPSIGVGAMILGENRIEAAPLLTMNTIHKEVVVSKNEGTYINVPSTVSDATIDVHYLINNLSGVLPSITMNATTRLGVVRVAIPPDTTINGPDEWTGVINMPTIKSNDSVSITPESGKTRVVQSVIEVGFNDLNLTFDKGIRLNIEGQAGNLVGFLRGGVFTKIDTTCTDDSQAAGNILAAGGDCKIDVGSDLVIWTKHFTSFATYTEETTVSDNGGGGASYLDEENFSSQNISLVSTSTISKIATFLFPAIIPSSTQSFFSITPTSTVNVSRSVSELFLNEIPTKNVVATSTATISSSSAKVFSFSLPQVAIPNFLSPEVKPQGTREWFPGLPKEFKIPPLFTIAATILIVVLYFMYYKKSKE